jgi:hypothetical protein
MSRGSRFGKYGERKRLERLKQILNESNKVPRGLKRKKGFSPAVPNKKRES